MRSSASVSMENGDRVQAVEHNGTIWLEILGPGDHEGFPVHARSAEQFEQLADAAAECAHRMRQKMARQFTIGSVMEQAG